MLPTGSPEARMLQIASANSRLTNDCCRRKIDKIEMTPGAQSRHDTVRMLRGMFVVTESDAAAIRAAFDRGGELSAAFICAGCSRASPTTCRRGNARAP
jgi:hypothetical protein